MSPGRLRTPARGWAAPVSGETSPTEMTNNIWCSFLLLSYFFFLDLLCPPSCTSSSLLLQYLLLHMSVIVRRSLIYYYQYRRRSADYDVVPGRAGSWWMLAHTHKYGYDDSCAADTMQQGVTNACTATKSTLGTRSPRSVVSARVK